MKKLLLFYGCFLVLCISSMSFGQNTDVLGSLLSPNMQTNAIPKELKMPDAILPYLKAEFNNTIGKQATFDTQFKIVMLITRITNVPSKKYDLLEEIILFDVKNVNKSAQKIISVSPDARVLAIQAISESSNSTYVPSILNVIERDNSLKPRIAAAKVLPALGNNDMIVPKLIELLKTQYGSSRGKFDEQDTARFDDDRVAQAIIETLGVLATLARFRLSSRQS